MPARINHNAHLSAIHRNLGVHFENANRQMDQVASGHRVNRSSDDAAKLALANDIESETRVLQEGGRNVQQSIQMLQVAEGALAQISDISRRMRELAVQSTTLAYSESNRQSVNIEFQQLKNEVNRIAEFTSYNDLPLLDAERELAIQSGPSERSNDARIHIGDMRASGSQLNLAAISIDTIAGAQQAIDFLDQAQDRVMEQRNEIAAFHNRLQMSVDTTATIVERMQGAESNIRDVDVARAVSSITRSQILSQTATGLAREADADISRILSLLQ
tara:strand:- start:911 stop:1735 length:825 start_codon:yes stop_codon:yes gene_type:complete